VFLSIRQEGKEIGMYYNTRGERVSRARFKEMYTALQNRQELFKAGLMNRRDLSSWVF